MVLMDHSSARPGGYHVHERVRRGLPPGYFTAAADMLSSLGSRTWAQTWAPRCGGCAGRGRRGRQRQELGCIRAQKMAAKQVSEDADAGRCGAQAQGQGCGGGAGMGSRGDGNRDVGEGGAGDGRRATGEG